MYAWTVEISVDVTYEYWKLRWVKIKLGGLRNMRSTGSHLLTVL